MIAGYDATLTHEVVGDARVPLFRVADLERHVDRAALLAAADAPEPPYWAHCWTGARVLAAAVPSRPGRVLELGCGLALPGLVAARRGGWTTLVDRIPAALAFAQASAEAGALTVTACVADWLAAPFGAVFDTILAAELLYDRATLAAAPAALVRHLRPGGVALVADAARIDTRPFFAALDASGLAWHATEHRRREEGLPITVRLVTIRR